MWRDHMSPGTERKLSHVLAAIYGLSSPFTVALNLLVLVALYRVSSLRSKSNLMIGGLALTDLITGLLINPIMIADSLSPPKCGNKLAALSCTVVVGSFAYQLVLLNIDRYLAMKHTFEYPRIVTTQRVFKVNAFAWAWAIIVAATDSFPVLSAIYNTIWVACVCVCVYCLGTVLMITQRHRRAILKQHRASGMPRKAVQRSNTGYLFVIVTVIFIISSLSIVICRFFSNNSVRPILQLLIIQNSLFNPLVYTLQSSAFRKAFRRVLGISSSNREVPVAVYKVRNDIVQFRHRFP
ncbi:predicted protein [Nematostella vectensis]|uniref:G-protein coupled receptors family 1 profile domain-containing protein n=1 Tax=Nematostella vectensis TaxID=45351 RepID=A7S3H8_NEMVE|nr:predicted protein [Nematostella vectensis]|eukprot:XP_001633836.1 predicted protein [Nematostella vectensis]